MNNIDTIIFDLGSVLIAWDPFPVLLKSFNNDNQKTRWFLENICSFEFNSSLDMGKSFEDAKKEKTAEYPQYEKYIADYIDKWQDMLLGEIPGTVKILKSLKESGKYRLYAITNWSAEKFPIARKRYTFLKWFDDIVVSGEVGMVKPNSDIYEYSIKRFNLNGNSKALFIDDRLENIEMAEQFGLLGIHYKNTQQLETDLKDMGIDV